MTDLSLIYEEVAALEERVEDLEAKLAQVERLRDRVDELDERTDLMQLVDDSDELDARGRSIRLLQHMQRAAQRQRHDHTSLTRDQAAEALHYPDVDRTTIYTDMRRAARLVDDEAICWYHSSDEGDIDEAVLHLDAGAFAAAVEAGAIDRALVERSTTENGGA